MVQTFGILSVMLMLYARHYFVRQIQQGKSTPNLTTWLIGLIVSLVNALTFYKVVDGNIWKGLIMFASLLTLVWIFIYSLSRGKFAKVTTFDVIMLVVAVFLGVIWKFTSDRWANFIVQIIIVISSIPTLRGLWLGYLREYYVSWLFSIGAYLCAIASILSDFHGDWLQLFGPILNGIVMNVIIMLLSFKKQKIN